MPFTAELSLRMFGVCSRCAQRRILNTVDFLAQLTTCLSCLTTRRASPHGLNQQTLTMSYQTFTLTSTTCHQHTPHSSRLLPDPCTMPQRKPTLTRATSEDLRHATAPRNSTAAACHCICCLTQCGILRHQSSNSSCT